MDAQKVYKDRKQFLKALKAACKQAGIDLKGAKLKLVWKALSEPDDSAQPCRDSKGNIEPDSDLRDYENVPLKENIDDYFQREVLPHVPDAWVDYGKTKVGYEIPINRHFYVYKPLRPLDEIEADIAGLEGEIAGLLEGLVA